MSRVGLGFLGLLRRIDRGELLLTRQLDAGFEKVKEGKNHGLVRKSVSDVSSYRMPPIHTTQTCTRTRTRTSFARLSKTFIPPSNLHPILRRLVGVCEFFLLLLAQVSSIRQPRQLPRPALSHAHHVHHMALQDAFGGVVTQERAGEVCRVVLAYEQTRAEREATVATEESVD